MAGAAQVSVRVAHPDGPPASLVARPGTGGRRALAPRRRSGEPRSGDPRADALALVAGDGGGAGSAWTVVSAAAAARRRWSGGHRAVATVTELTLPDPRPDAVAALLARARTDLDALGVRRVDLLTSPDDPVLAPLRDAGWFTGAVGHDVVASWCIRAAWRSQEDLDPHRRRSRIRRRLDDVRPRDLPELLRRAAAEARGRLDERRHPPPIAHLVEPPPGSVRHAATRFHTVRRALDLVPEEFRDRRLLDVGCGGGRVLAVARDLGFTDLAGVDHDPGLVAAARARLGPSARIEQADVRTAPIDDAVGTVYLFNPLDEVGVADVADQLAASLRRAPRPLLVVYVNPRAVASLLDVGLSMVHLEPQFCVLAT